MHNKFVIPYLKNIGRLISSIYITQKGTLHEADNLCRERAVITLAIHISKLIISFFIWLLVSTKVYNVCCLEYVD